MREENKNDVLTVGSGGVVALPEWAWKRLLKMSGVRSKKKRIQKKAVKKLFIKILKEEMGRND